MNECDDFIEANHEIHNGGTIDDHLFNHEYKVEVCDCINLRSHRRRQKSQCKKCKKIFHKPCASVDIPNMMMKMVLLHVH